jgi:hypothetical protein
LPRIQLHSRLYGGNVSRRFLLAVRYATNLCHSEPDPGEGFGKIETRAL